VPINLLCVFVTYDITWHIICAFYQLFSLVSKLYHVMVQLIKDVHAILWHFGRHTCFKGRKGMMMCVDNLFCNLLLFMGQKMAHNPMQTRWTMQRGVYIPNSKWWHHSVELSWMRRCKMHKAHKSQIFVAKLWGFFQWAMVKVCENKVKLLIKIKLLPIYKEGPWMDGCTILLPFRSGVADYCHFLDHIILRNLPVMNHTIV
jgi:hypothetical protein